MPLTKANETGFVRESMARDRLPTARLTSPALLAAASDATPFNEAVMPVVACSSTGEVPETSKFPVPLMLPACALSVSCPMLEYSHPAFHEMPPADVIVSVRMFGTPGSITTVPLSFLIWIDPLDDVVIVTSVVFSDALIVESRSCHGFVVAGLATKPGPGLLFESVAPLSSCTTVRSSGSSSSMPERQCGARVSVVPL